MIENLSEYIRVNLSITPITNGVDSSSDQIGLFLTDTGGNEAPRIGTKMRTVQVKSSYESRPVAKKNIEAVYDLLSNRYAITLPAVTVDGELMPAINVAAILSLQTPGYLGVDANGHHMFSVNFKLTTKEGY